MLAWTGQHTVNFKWEQINISRRLTVRVHFNSVKSDSEQLLPECSIGMEEAWSKDDSSRSTHGNLCMVYLKLFFSLTVSLRLCMATDHCDDNLRGIYSQTVQTVAEVASGKGHAKTMLQIQLMSWVWSLLVHACVAIVVAAPKQSQTLCCYSWLVCHDTNQHNVLLAQARPTMLKLLVMGHEASKKSMQLGE